MKRLIFISTLVFIALFAFSSCEEDADILDNVVIKKETDNDTNKESKPSITNNNGN